MTLSPVVVFYLLCNITQGRTSARCVVRVMISPRQIKELQMCSHTYTFKEKLSCAKYKNTDKETVPQVFIKRLWNTILKPCNSVHSSYSWWINLMINVGHISATFKVSTAVPWMQDKTAQHIRSGCTYTSLEHSCSSLLSNETLLQCLHFLPLCQSSTTPAFFLKFPKGPTKPLSNTSTL